MVGEGGWSFICKNIVPVMSSGMMLMGKPATIATVSGEDRSATHKNSAPRSSIAVRSMVKNPKKMGI